MSKWIRRVQQGIQQRRWLVAIVLVLLVGIIGLSVLIVNATNRLERAYESLDRVLYLLNDAPGTSLTLEDFDALDEAIDEVLTRIERMRFYTLVLRPIGGIHPELSAAFNNLDTAYELSSAADLMLGGVRPVLFYLVAGDDDSQLTGGLRGGLRAQQLLDFALPGFDSAADHLSVAGEMLSQMTPAEISEGQFLLYLQLQDFHTQLTDLNQVLQDSPVLLKMLMGIDTPQTYLVLAQNNDEIRPSGGFIGTYGWFRIHNGHITDFDYNASTDNSPIPPDNDFLDEFVIPGWWINYERPLYAAWDGSHSVDFAATAAYAADYYDAGQNAGSPVAGVIAIDLTGFELLLDAVGEIAVPEYNVIVNADNFRERIYDIRAARERPVDHKRFLADVYGAIQTAWATLPPDKIADVGAAVLAGLQQKHLMLYVRDETIQDALVHLNIAGTQPEHSSQDYLLVTDANLSGNKSNNSIERSIAYDVILDADGNAEQRLSLLYEYFDSTAQNDPAVNPRYHGPLLYVNQLQIFAPEDAVLADNPNFPELETIDTGGFQHFVARLRLDYDSSARYEIRYATPELVREMGDYRHYRLYIQKQPGQRSETLSIRVTLPEGAELIASNPDEPALYERDDVTALDFLIIQTADTWIDVIYRLP